MIQDSISDTMKEVRSVIDGLEEGSIEWELMNLAHSELSTASKLVFEVNRMRFAELMNG